MLRVALVTATVDNNIMTDNTKHNRRKQAWEQLPTPRVSWEDFKRMLDRSSSIKQAVTRAINRINKRGTK